jgi:hypothetical protein
MCLRNVELVEQQGESGRGPVLALIPLLTEEEARVQAGAAAAASEDPGSVKTLIVVDVLCSNRACFFRDEGRWWPDFALHRKQPSRRSCGSSACLTASRCCLVILSRPTHKRKRYVLDEHSVDLEPRRRLH